ncbi:hypothetical protein CAI16_05435 [Virgibacillus dokdonensis]|uniref:Uncharacterized protein n=2 Tax=Virgibacillus dokdonensis TaxID=302167 RepID=A0A3E0WVN8_9BACI|nr:hypothetical protein CAI16_05435 [Virgibacillus dokdonensis]
MKAYRLKRIDKEHDMHLQAWLNHQVTSTKEQGKKQVPVFRSFKDFFNYDKRIEEETNPKLNMSQKAMKMARIAAVANRKGVNNG